MNVFHNARSIIDEPLMAEIKGERAEQKYQHVRVTNSERTMSFKIQLLLKGMNRRLRRVIFSYLSQWSAKQCSAVKE